MHNLKNKAIQVLSLLVALIMISGHITIQTLAISMKTVHGSIEKGKVKVELTSDNVADTIIINLFPDNLYFAEQFVGYNFVYPGLNFTGAFILINNSGQTYKVTDFSFEADTAFIRRVYNDAAKNKYGGITVASRDIVANLSGEEWYQLNAEYYGIENFYDLEVARKILGYGDSSQGLDIGIETSPEIIALGEWYLFNKSQFSFNTDKYPVNNLDVKNITLQDYIDKTSGNIDLVLNNCFHEIGENGFTSTIGYSIDNPSVGNAYNGAYSDFKFTLTLSRVIKGVKVSYNGNGNTGGIAPIDNNLYEIGSSVVVLDNVGNLVKEGFVFNEWNTSPDGNGTQLKVGDLFFIDSDITLYALWVPVIDPPPIIMPPPTYTPTPTPLPTYTPTPLPTYTSTPLPTDTPTPLPTDTPTPLPTDTLTPPPIIMPPPTPEPTPLPTYTLTPLPTDTLTPLPTDTLTPLPTDTPTSSPTPLPTDTSTPLPTYTLTPLPTDTSTPLPTYTLTPLPTPLPTDTPTPLPTDIPGPLPTDTLTPLPTDIPTPLPTYTPTPLPTYTPTPLPTYTPTPLPTYTPTPLSTDTPTPLSTDTPRPDPEPTAAPELQVILPEITEATDPSTSHSDLEYFKHIKYIYGYPDGSVRPDNSITRSETASIFFHLLTSSIKNGIYTSNFNDVSSDSWYSQAVGYLAYMDVITGYADNTFRPDSSITRAEFATIVARFDTLDLADENFFSDVPDNHWAAKYINSVYIKGLIKGYDNGTFRPEQNITRAEAVKLVNTLFDRLVKPEDLNDSLNPFNDLTRSHWGFPHILEAALEHFYTRNDDGTETWNR